MATTVISGTSAIDDTLLRSTDPEFDYNYGTHTSNYASKGATPTLRSIIKTDLSSLPVGITITACDLNMTFSAGFVGTAVIKLYSIKDANDWVEGTKNGAAETGSTTFNNVKHATQAWAGSAGCRTSGTDFDATEVGSESVVNGSADDAVAVSFSDVSVVQDWFDGNRVNNGVFMGDLVGSGITQPTFYSTEGGTPPTWSVTYTLPPRSKTYSFGGGSFFPAKRDFQRIPKKFGKCRTIKGG